MEQTTSSSSFTRIKETIAEKLEKAAGSLEGTESSQALGPYSQQASHWLHQSARYIRSFDIDEADARMRGYIRVHPGQSVLIGVATGFVVGYLVRRR
jgi:outer membrane protein assembly factor BamD (BamD/ComL family)